MKKTSWYRVNIYSVLCIRVASHTGLDLQPSNTMYSGTVWSKGSRKTIQNSQSHRPNNNKNARIGSKTITVIESTKNKSML